MAAGRYLPAEGTPEGLAHYFRLIHEFAGSLEMKTPILDTAITLYERVMAAGLGENDNAVLVEFAGRDNQDAGGGRGS
jgi:3-hydroxyisobutyrate dehydrogenase-like beta-hydroxyacid dehydrogenase